MPLSVITDRVLLTSYTYPERSNRWLGKDHDYGAFQAFSHICRSVSAAFHEDLADAHSWETDSLLPDFTVLLTGAERSATLVPSPTQPQRLFTYSDGSAGLQAEPLLVVVDIAYQLSGFPSDCVKWRVRNALAKTVDNSSSPNGFRLEAAWYWMQAETMALPGHSDWFYPRGRFDEFNAKYEVPKFNPNRMPADLQRRVLEQEARIRSR